MNPVRKLVVVLALVTVSTLASGSAAFTAPAQTFHAASAIACGCCPKTCLGGTYVSCYQTINMPSYAVTCLYEKTYGPVYACMSCLNVAYDL